MLSNSGDFKVKTNRRKPRPQHTQNSPPQENRGHSSRKNEVKIPKAVLDQLELRKKYKYSYRVVNNGNIQNNSTIYVVTGVAHPHQLDAQIQNVITRAKNMPEVFGQDFECDFQINVVRRYTGEYMGYAFVDVTNPKLYYALLGFNVDGSDRAEYVDDPNWVRPEFVPKEKKERVALTIANLMTEDWCCSSDEQEKPLSPPKLRKELPPLLTLGEYEYDEQQKGHFETEVLNGSFSVSPAFISPGIKEEYDDCSLYVSEVPAVDYDFLYNIFARYARTNSSRENDTQFFPRINIKECSKEKMNKDETKTGIFAIVEFGDQKDCAFCLAMIQRLRASYNGKDVSMAVRYAFRSKNGRK